MAHNMRSIQYGVAVLCLIANVLEAKQTRTVNCHLNEKDIAHTAGKISDATLSRDPYPHAIIHDIFSPEAFTCLQEAMVAVRKLKMASGSVAKLTPKQISKARRRYFYIKVVPVRSAASFRRFSVLFDHRSVKRASLSLFEEPLSLRTPVVTRNTKSFARQLVTVDSSSYGILPHTDVKQKLVTFIVYLPDLNDPKLYHLGTSVLRRKQSIPTKEGQAAWEDFQTVHQVSYKQNVALAFSACNSSWHGVKDVGAILKPRYSFQVFVQHEKKAKQNELSSTGGCHRRR